MRKKEEDFEYIYTNKAASQIFTYSPYGKTIRDMNLASVGETILHYYHLAMATKKQQCFEDYDVFQHEVRKHETSVYPFEEDGECYILAISKEIKFNRDLQDKYLFMRSVFLNSFFSTVLISSNLTFLEANQRFLKDFGICLENAQGQLFIDLPFIEKAEIKNWQQYLVDAQNGDNFTSKIVRFLDKNGVKRQFTATFSPMKNEKEEVIAIFLILQEITAFVAQQKALIETSKELSKIECIFKVVTENINDFIVLLDEDGTIDYISPSYARVSNLDEKDFIGKNYLDFLTPESRALLKEKMLKMSDKEITVELSFTTSTGEILWSESKCTKVVTDSATHVTQFIMISREITERKKLESALRHMAYHDNLTQLPNRRYLEKEFPTMMEQAKKADKSLAVLYIDGDYFKNINDEYGHDVGDEFLQLTSRILQNSIEDGDLVVRMGGDEFLVIYANLPLLKGERHNRVVQKIQHMQVNLQKGGHIRSLHFAPTVSIGVSYNETYEDSLEQLIEKADQALYQAKLTAKNSFVIYDDVQ